MYKKLKARKKFKIKLQILLMLLKEAFQEQK